MIVNIRGTHGSGKTSLVRAFMERHDTTPIQGKKKPDGYVCQTHWGEVRVVGSYETSCGGCDGIQPYALIWPRVLEYAALGHVLFEGALVSNSYGNIGRDSEEYGDEFVFAFLDTPLQTCIDRILQRRVERGNLKPFDPNKSVVRIYKSNASVKEKAISYGRRVVTLNHTKPLPQLLRIFNNG